MSRENELERWRRATLLDQLDPELSRHPQNRLLSYNDVKLADLGGTQERLQAAVDRQENSFVDDRPSLSSA